MHKRQFRLLFTTYLTATTTHATFPHLSHYRSPSKPTHSYRSTFTGIRVFLAVVLPSGSFTIDRRTLAGPSPPITIRHERGRSARPEPGSCGSQRMAMRLVVLRLVSVSKPVTGKQNHTSFLAKLVKPMINETGGNLISKERNEIPTMEQALFLTAALSYTCQIGSSFSDLPPTFIFTISFVLLSYSPWVANLRTHPISAFLWVLAGYHPQYVLFFRCSECKTNRIYWPYSACSIALGGLLTYVGRGETLFVREEELR